MKKIRLYKLAIIIGVLILPFTVRAFFQAKEQNLFVAPEEIVLGDYIKIADSIDIAGKVEGDVIAVASQLKIRGSVGGDIIALASQIIIEGEVFGNIRVMASNVKISGTVERNVNVFAANATITKESEIGKNVYVSVDILDSKGKIQGNYFIKAGSVMLGNEVEGDVSASVETDGKIIVFPETRVNGNFLYEAESESQLELKQGSQILGKKQFKKKITGKQLTRFLDKAFVFGKILNLFGLLTVGLIFISLIPKKVMEIYHEMTKNPTQLMLRGFLYLFFGPFLMILLLFTIIGIPLAIILVPLYLIVIYFSKVFAGIAIGIFIFQYAGKGKIPGNLFLPMVLGSLVLVIFSNILYLGWVVNICAIIWAAGVIFENLRKEIIQWR